MSQPTALSTSLSACYGWLHHNILIKKALSTTCTLVNDVRPLHEVGSSHLKAFERRKLEQDIYSCQPGIGSVMEGLAVATSVVDVYQRMCGRWRMTVLPSRSYFLVLVLLIVHTSILASSFTWSGRRAHAQHQQ